MGRVVGTAWLLLLAACVGSGPPTSIVRSAGDPDPGAFPPMASGAAPGPSPQARATARALGRGINFGNMLEAPLEGEWGPRLSDHFFDLVKEAGFTAVRLPVRWSNHASVDAEARLDESFAARVDHAIDEALKRGLTIVVNMHHYRQLDGDTLDARETRVSEALLEQRFLHMWKQIAERYKGRSPQLVFELYNEPHGRQEASWNLLAARALGVVRRSNPERIVVIGPTQWNSAHALRNLVLPNDANLIVTFHNYDPFTFTHQGAEWASPRLPTGVDCCNADQKKAVTDALDVAAAWSKATRYPVWLGEFGSYGKADMESRAAYTRYVRDEAQRRDIPWAYWELAAGFGAYDPAVQAWRAPLKNALVGP